MRNIAGSWFRSIAQKFAPCAGCIILWTTGAPFHAVADNGEARVFGFGDNSFGALGLGETEYIEYPTAVPVSSRIVKSVGQGVHCLFLDMDGRLWGTGHNAIGQLGLGDLINRNSATLIPTNGKVITMAVGISHSVFVTEDGKLWGMGFNTKGELGRAPEGDYDSLFSTGIDDIDPAILVDCFLSPVEIPVQGKVIDVSCAQSITVFVTEDGQMWGMGESLNGQLGIWNENVHTPRKIETAGPVRKVSAGAWFTLYITEDDRLWSLPGNPQSGDYPTALSLHGTSAESLAAAEWTGVSAREIADGVVDAACYDLIWQSETTGDNPAPMDKDELSFDILYVKKNGELWNLQNNQEYLLVAENVSSVETGVFSVAYIDRIGALWVDRTISPSFDVGRYRFSKVADNVSFVSCGFFSCHYGIGFTNVSREILICTTETRNCWSIDPQGILGSNAAYTLEGVLPGRLCIDNECITGYIPETGEYRFSMFGVDGLNESRVEFWIRVLPPTRTPLFLGVSVNGTAHPSVIVEGPGYGTPAITELMVYQLPLGEPLDIRFEWDCIKPPYSFRIVGGALPPGLVLDGNTGGISGCPSESGTYTFVVSVKDWRGRGYQWMRLSIE
ncbi:MAG: putative Ig domain-containing protein [Opitutales bacterium]|nr:putative Ig domain-containing protein [Opitutales bacterium]